MYRVCLDIVAKIVFPRRSLGIIYDVLDHDTSLATNCIQLLLREIMKCRELDLGDVLRIRSSVVCLAYGERQSTYVRALAHNLLRLFLKLAKKIDPRSGNASFKVRVRRSNLAFDLRKTRRAWPKLRL